ncbi:MAG: hypothetical protein PVH25_09515 [Burkholderiales bacterium]
MNTVTRALIALLSINFLLGAAQAEENATCPYCATWKPLSGHRFLSAEVLIVSKDQVALPGCNAVKATLLRDQAHPGIITAEGLPPALLVYFRLDESPLCSPSISGVESGALLELQYVPTRSAGGGEVELRVLHAHEIPGMDRTSSSAQWFAVRSHEN